MKLITLCTLSACCISVMAARTTVTPPMSSYLGTWKVSLLCNENFCQGPEGIKRQATGGSESQIWIVTQQNGSYTLDAGSRFKEIGGQVLRHELNFNKIVGGSDTSAARQIIFTVNKKGKLEGKYNLALPSVNGVCIKRYTVTGQR